MCNLFLCICALLLYSPAVEGAAGGSLVPLGFTAQMLPSDTCTPGGAACQPPYQTCSTNKLASTCSSGVDTVYGYCGLTRCGACNRCLKNVRLFTSTVKEVSDSIAVSTEWMSFCNGTLHRPPAECRRVQQEILVSPQGDAAKRAGKICEVLQDCANIPLDCQLEAAQGGPNPARGPLDLCTRDGTSLGEQVSGVQSPSSFVLQHNLGQCFTRSDCSTGWLCDMQKSTSAKTCREGVEGLMTVGTCTQTACQNCQVSVGLMHQKFLTVPGLYTASILETVCFPRVTRARHRSGAEQHR
jgi:hypothetical protein